MKLVNQKKARELGKEIIRCEKIVSNPEKYTDIEVEQAKNKINLIAQAYRNNMEMMFAIIGEAEKAAENEL